MGSSKLTVGPGRPILTGQVTEFSAVRGVGSVRDGQGRDWFFHCTQIVDGSRDIEVGAMVGFVVVPGHGGRYEASALRRSVARPMPPASPDSSPKPASAG